MPSHKKPQTDRFMIALQKLRGKDASEDEAKGAAGQLFPTESKTDKGYRSRFMRLFKASDEIFENSVRLWKEEDAHIGKILKRVPVVSNAGAPNRNLNALGKRRASQLDTLNGTWRAACRQDRDAFLEKNRLRRA